MKVIIEAALLTDEEKVKACLICKKVGADFVKTSTGFSKGGETVGDVALMKYVVGSSIGVKAAGGIRSKEQAEAMIASGADGRGDPAEEKPHLPLRENGRLARAFYRGAQEAV